MIVLQIEEPALARLVGLIGLLPTVIDRKLLEVGENGEAQARRPGIAAKLKGGIHPCLDVDGGLLGLHKKLAIPSQPKAVIRILDALLHPDGLFHLDLLEIAG